MRPKEWTQMVDAVPQIRAVLERLDTSVTYKVLSRWPRREDNGNLVTITEITNTQTNIVVVDELAYQIDLWGTDMDAVRVLSPLVNAAVCGIGFRRDYAGPPEPVRDGKFYRRTFRYGRRVDKRTMRLID